MKPETRPPFFERYDMNRVIRFVVDATGAMASLRSRDEQVPHRASPRRRQLFSEARALLGTSPSSDAGRDLGRRMTALIRDEFGDDAELIADLKRFWARRHHWPDAVTAFMASTYELDVPTWHAVADYLDAAMAAAG
jgi:hypothetical protein